ncbi:DUF4124 domain-containing protein [Rheinheimera gaetbuli]
MKMIVLASMVFTALLHQPAAAQVYKWVDEKGNVHYSDRPQTLDSERVDFLAAPPADVAEDGSASSVQSVDDNVRPADPANADAVDANVVEPEPPVVSFTPPAPLANCSAAAENARRILLSQNSKPEFRQLAADANFKTSFVQACRQNANTEAGRAEAVCIQRAKNFADFEACSG